jgi:hypothetical protein
MELACLPVVCSDVGILATDSGQQFRTLIEQLSSQLNALHRSQRLRLD